MTFDDAEGRRLVAVMPHPDDEAYSVAGTLSLAARSGAQVTLVTATRGESGWIRGQAGVEGIAETRTHELECACQAIGIGPAQILGWPDGGISRVDTDTARQQLSECFDLLDPDVILTLAVDGVYGHRDHVSLTRLVSEVAGPRRLLHGDFPSRLFERFATKFRQHAPELLVEDLEPAKLGIDQRLADLVVRLDDAATAAKKAAIACHASQLLDSEPLSFLFPGLVEAVCDREWLTFASGAPLPSGASSPFAGLS